MGFAAENKVSYLFGDLDPYDSPVGILEGAALYLEKEDGIMKKPERPENLKNNVLARIPILPKE
jgi:predicted metal-binding protein